MTSPLVARKIREEGSKHFFEIDSALYVRTCFIVVELAVVNHKHKIRIKHLSRLVVIVLTNSLFNGGQINRLLDDLQIVRNSSEDKW